jgi:hypothetical protein
MLSVEPYTIGIGDRFAHQGRAQMPEECGSGWIRRKDEVAIDGPRPRLKIHAALK